MQLMPIDLVRGDVELPSLSNVFQQFTAKIDDPSATAEDFSEIISSDPSLTVKLLKVVNSAYYSFSSTINDVAHAITIIGLNDLREMVLAISVVEFFDGLPNDLVSMKSFWKHSVLTGLLAKEFQSSPAIKSRQSLFTAGMLHDVGSLVVYNKLPEISRNVLEQSELQETPRYLLERQIIGFDHAAVGGELMSHWELPEYLIDVVSHQYEPQKAQKFSEEALVVKLVSELARSLEAGEFIASQFMEQFSKASLAINESDLEANIAAANENLSSVLTAIHSG